MTKNLKVKTIEDVKSLLRHYLVGVKVKDLTTGLVSHCSPEVVLALFNQCEYVSHYRHSESGFGEVLDLKVRSNKEEVANKYLVGEYSSAPEFINSFKKTHLVGEIYSVLPTQIAYIGKGADFLARHRGSVKVYSTDNNGKVAVMLKDSLIWEYFKW